MRALLMVLAIVIAFPAVAAGRDDVSSGEICRKLEGREPPAADRPTSAQARALKGCDSEALYYGEKGPSDFAKARLCAFLEDAKGEGNSRTADVFSGRTILMQIYANGLGGVKRDLDQATAYACGIDGAPAEIEFRVARLQALKTKPEVRRFDYCDDITSGLAGGFCAARDAEIAKKARAAKLAGIEGRIPPTARAALAVLRRASATFIDAHGGEVDETGTARAQMIIDEEEATRSAFTALLEQLVDGRWPPATEAHAKSSDLALNTAYRHALAYLGSSDNLTTVKPEDARKAQRAWIVYRDAFIAFARLAAPKTSAEAIAARLTEERSKQLSDLAS